MRIESKGIVISEIFSKNANGGESIEISPDGKTVTLVLASEDGAHGYYKYDVPAFRQLLDAMVAAERKINQIENPAAAA